MRPVVALAALLLSCSDGGGPEKNPTKLWLALDGSERAVKLSVQEPIPY